LTESDFGVDVQLSRCGHDVILHRNVLSSGDWCICCSVRQLHTSTCVYSSLSIILYLYLL